MNPINAAVLRIWILLTLVAVAFLSASGFPPRDARRKIACKTPEIAASCYWTHGRLGSANGNPTFRLWKIGTHRILGIVSGPGALERNPDDGVDPELPANVERVFTSSSTRIFADFEVCPLEPEKPGVMQRVCIECAKNIFVEH